MFTRPQDLAEVLLRAALADGWNFRPEVLSYQPVGFGSYHWLASDAAGHRLFVTADDLDAKRRAASDTTDAAFARLERAFESALSLSRDAALEFVVAPVPAADGRVLRRLTERYSLVVHPYLADCQPGYEGEFTTKADRLAVLDLLVKLHGATATPPVSDDFAVPRIAELRAAMGSTGEPWRAGPYGTCGRDLLARNAADLATLISVHADLAARVAARADRMVITHGEPSAANVLKAPSGFRFVDWESALLAPPERDLWELAESDPAVLPAYAAASGTVIDRDALVLYRLWYDLFEIAGYISWFRENHAESADTAEAWQNLQYYLRPADRWPELC